ncbi:MAG: hypothetical protein P3W93_004890, partial [Thermus sp.]|nr:hypothetical protein [Thermus sp.]
AYQALRLGYKGYLYPEQSLEDLVQALRKVAEGEVWAERRVVAHLVEEPIPQLSPREKGVAALAAVGLSNREIGVAFPGAVSSCSSCPRVVVKHVSHPTYH